MSLISLLIFVVVIGLVLYLINTYLPMPPVFKTVINVIVVLFIIIWLLQSLGFTGGPVLRFR